MTKLLIFCLLCSIYISNAVEIITVRMRDQIALNYVHIL